MPIDERRREEITTAVAAYNEAHPKTPLPRRAAQLLTVMFAPGDECRRSLEDLVAEGFDRQTLLHTLRRLLKAGFLSKQRESRRAPNTCHLYLPPRVQP